MSELDRLFTEIQGCRADVSEVKGIAIRIDERTEQLSGRVDAIEARHQKLDDGKGERRRHWVRAILLSLLGAAFTLGTVYLTHALW